MTSTRGAAATGSGRDQSTSCCRCGCSIRIRALADKAGWLPGAGKWTGKTVIPNAKGGLIGGESGDHGGAQLTGAAVTKYRTGARNELRFRCHINDLLRKMVPGKGLLNSQSTQLNSLYFLLIYVTPDQQYDTNSGLSLGCAYWFSGPEKALDGAAPQGGLRGGSEAPIRRLSSPLRNLSQRGQRLDFC